MNKFYFKKNNSTCFTKRKHSRGFTRLVDFGDAIISHTKSASPKFTTGFTIIETMISVSVFLVVVMIGIDSLLNASLQHQKSRDQRSVMDNLTFIMEDMSRNIRTGYNFRCVSTVFNSGEATGATGNTSQSCALGGGAIVFENAFGLPYDPLTLNEHTEDQWVYKIESPDGGLNYNIYKSVNGAVSFTQLNSNEININGTSGFYITGAKKSEKQQPLATIRLIGKITTKRSVTPFALETTVSQRTSK